MNPVWLLIPVIPAVTSEELSIHVDPLGGEIWNNILAVRKSGHTLRKGTKWCLERTVLVALSIGDVLQERLPSCGDIVLLPAQSIPLDMTPVVFDV